MTRLETPFQTLDDLIFVQGRIDGPHGSTTVRLVLDTGAAHTTITPSVIEYVGYTASNSLRKRTVRTFIGREHGYEIKVDQFSSLGITAFNLEVDVFELGFEDIDGLIGMNFLSQLNFEVRPCERRIFIEPATRLSQASP